MAVNSDIMRGVAEPVILNLLNTKEMYGYEIIKTVNERTEGAFQWREGMLYPCLHRLESKGLITSSWVTAENGKPRKYYALTRKGRAAVGEKVQELHDLCNAVHSLLMA